MLRKVEPYIGMKLRLQDTNGNTFNTVTLQQGSGQTVEQAYAAAVKELTAKRIGWQPVFPNDTFVIVAQ